MRAEREGYDAFVIRTFSGCGSLRGSLGRRHSGGSARRSVYVVQLPARLTQRHRHNQYALHPVVSPSDHEATDSERRVTGVHAMQFEPGQILKAYESQHLADEVARLFAEQARPLVASGVDVLIPGGGIPMLLFSAIRGHAVDGAPVIKRHSDRR